MASKRIIIKKSHIVKLPPSGEMRLAKGSYCLFDDAFSAELLALDVAVLEQDVLDGKVDPETLEPFPVAIADPPETG